MRTFLSLFFFLRATILLAAEGMQVIPMWERTDCGNEVKACYDFDEAQGLYKLDLKLQVELKKVELFEAREKDLQQAITKLDQIDYLNQRSINNLQEILKENQKVIEQLKKENLDLRNPSFFDRWFVLAAGAIVLFATGVAVGQLF